MEDRLFTAQVHIVNEHLTLIHIPIDLYPFYIKPILQLLFDDVARIGDNSPGGSDMLTSSLPDFLNIAVTPVECSVVCSRELADRCFMPLLESQQRTMASGSSRVQVSSEDFVVMQVEGQGLDAGQRVLEITRPLAMAGISIFFISTYFSDYILFPRHAKCNVVQALTSRGFNFETPVDTFAHGSRARYERQASPYSIPPHSSPPEIPPPSSIAELQNRTFGSLREHSVRPHVDETLQIVHCAAHYTGLERNSYSVIRPSLTTVLLLDNPRFLSFTVTATDPSPSILLEKRLLPRFRLDLQPNALSTNLVANGDSLLLGSKDDVLIPIMLDLRDLPLEATGMVCAVFSRMAVPSGDVERQKGYQKSGSVSRSHSSQEEAGEWHQELAQDTSRVGAVEISFLSTTRAGTVIVNARDLRRAIASLEADEDNSDAHSEIFGALTL